jgi:hypothetical protein
LVGADLNGAKITESDFVGANLAEIKRSQPWSAADKNRFQGDVKVAINGNAIVIEKEVESSTPVLSIPPSSPITTPGNTGTSQNNTQSNTVNGNRNDFPQGGRGNAGNTDRIDGVLGGPETNTIRTERPVTRGGRDLRVEQRRRPQKVRRRYSIPAWVGFTQTSTTGGARYHDSDHPDSILELW